MPTGAVVREWPMGFSVWNEDESAPDGSGYRLLETYKNDPSREMVNELYDVRIPFETIYTELSSNSFPSI